MAAALRRAARLGLTPGHYMTVTLHRPSNVDDPAILKGILEALAELSERMPVVFPIHPRTRKMVDQAGLGGLLTSGDRVPEHGLWACEPLGYLEFLHLNMNARLVLTDSGGLQEETSVLGVPCLTLRHNTERPITCSEGTNALVGNEKARILAAAGEVLDRPPGVARVPEKWDGHAAERIVEILARTL